MNSIKTLVVAMLLSMVATAAYAGTAFFSYETTSGMSKICYYTYMGSTVAITISVTSLCPLTISQ